MYCERCGAVTDGHQYCPQCGTPVANVMPANNYYAGTQQVQGNPVKILVFGILSLALAGIIGLIFSIVTLNKSSNYIATYGNVSNQVRVGRKLAIAGLIVSIITIVFYVILFVIALNGNDFSLYKPPTTKL